MRALSFVLVVLAAPALADSDPAKWQTFDEATTEHYAQLGKRLALVPYCGNKLDPNDIKDAGELDEIIQNKDCDNTTMCRQIVTGYYSVFKQKMDYYRYAAENGQKEWACKQLKPTQNL